MLPPLPPGTILQGKYRVLGVVGGGGMALVYRAEEIQPAPGQIWAIKELQATSGSPEEQAEAQRQFRQEAGLLTHLSHPHLPRVADYFDEAGRSYLVMEFIEGRSLDKHLEAAGGGLPERDVLTWMVQVCRVLAYLHQQQPPIIFRDLKPSNIMLSTAGTIKLIDFGIARTYKVGKKRDTVAMGSENYAPPEQWGREQTDARSDIYSLGATMYHLITGTPPPQAFLPVPLPSPRSLNPAISLDTEQAIPKAMARERQNRYQTADEVEAALTSCLAHLSVSILPVPEPAVTGYPCPACGQPARPGARFCGYCGSHLGGGPLQGVLQVLGPSGSGWEMPLSKSPFFIGRKSVNEGIYPDLDLSSHDPDFVSRSHAQITRVGGQFILMDLGSANGTFVNGMWLPPHTPQVLHNGDRVTVGKVHLVFRLIA